MLLAASITVSNNDPLVTSEVFLSGVNVRTLRTHLSSTWLRGV